MLRAPQIGVEDFIRQPPFGMGNALVSRPFGQSEVTENDDFDFVWRRLRRIFLSQGTLLMHCSSPIHAGRRVCAGQFISKAAGPSWKFRG
jgi:hypothetical protein